MRLYYIYIGKYKNLKEFRLDFDGQSFIDLFVGKNATGKSNLFEALIEIFRHLYEFGSYKISFDYLLKYEVDGKFTEISWEKEHLKINGKRRKTIGKTPVPDNVVIYYSGHNTKVSALVEAYENSFKKTIKKADVQDTRKFIGVGKEYKTTNHVSLYPNPTSSLIHFDIQSSDRTIVNISLVDILGKVIHQDGQIVNEKASLLFDLSSYSNGVYFVIFRFEDELITRKIILNK